MCESDTQGVHKRKADSEWWTLHHLVCFSLPHAALEWSGSPYSSFCSSSPSYHGEPVGRVVTLGRLAAMAETTYLTMTREKMLDVRWKADNRDQPDALYYGQRIIDNREFRQATCTPLATGARSSS
jgi:hypothetical protein